MFSGQKVIVNVKVFFDKLIENVSINKVLIHWIQLI